MVAACSIVRVALANVKQKFHRSSAISGILVEVEFTSTLSSMDTHLLIISGGNTRRHKGQMREHKSRSAGAPEEPMPTPTPALRQLHCEEIDGHLYLVRKTNSYYVWLGRKTHVTALDNHALSALISYRLEFDGRCCGKVN
jgi:hypothetical protein